MNVRDGRESGLERRLRGEAPSAPGPDHGTLARVMARVNSCEPDRPGASPAIRVAGIGMFAAVVGVGLGAWLILARPGGIVETTRAAAPPPEARIVELLPNELTPPTAGGERALVDEGRRVLDDARRLGEALATRLAVLERASAGMPPGG